ncbi:MAG: phosphate ABC transporter permease PstA [Candidatus Hydrogenedentes bacterium]|nr:phosphate ABC transporter permease PstA [Candidatus Hydrogenedentota bacterium]
MASIIDPKFKRGFWQDGEPFVWGTAAALSAILISITILIAVIMVNGLGVMWPSDVALLSLQDGAQVFGLPLREDPILGSDAINLQIKTGNRDLYGADFRWVEKGTVRAIEYPSDVYTLERMEYGNFYGRFKRLGDGAAPASSEDLEKAWQAGQEEKERIAAAAEEVNALSRRIDGISGRVLKLKHSGTPENDATLQGLLGEQETAKQELQGRMAEQSALTQALLAHTATFVDAGGREMTIPLMNIVRLYQPSQMGIGAKSRFYLSKIGELLFDEPRESNTEGGLFPAIFGTVMLTFLMSLLSFPLGLLAGIYLREYAREGIFIRIVRIAVNNLAGIPSIVYGIFGLGFFVYGIGGTIDAWFFPERLPTPTFGTGGILWASLTLGILTVPVVIVSTEEALGAIPRGIREGAYALGSTKFQTLVRVLLPMASPGIMTGFILAMARAAGEVAPLMITGVVKLAPTLPLDAEYPFLHLDRKFMHLGFHIFDIGFQSPNVEAAKPMVFVTTLLLVLIVLLMSSTAIYMRGRMRERYSVRSL